MTIHQMGRMSKMEDTIFKKYGDRFSNTFSIDKYKSKIGATGKDTAISADNYWERPKAVAVTGEARAKIIETVRRQRADNELGVYSSKDGKEIDAIIKDYNKKIPNRDKGNVTYTMKTIESEESARIDAYIKKQDPTHKAGKPLAKDILDAIRDGSYMKQMPDKFNVTT